MAVKQGVHGAPPASMLIASPDAVVRLEQTAKHQAEARSRDRPSPNDRPSQGGFLRFFCFKQAPPDDDLVGVIHSDRSPNPAPHRARKAPPPPQPWNRDMETTILACISHIEAKGISEERPFAVSASQDDIEALQIPPRKACLPDDTDIHVACAVIKMLLRNATEPLVPMRVPDAWLAEGKTGGKAAGVGAAPTFAGSVLRRTLEEVKGKAGASRAVVLGRLMKLLGNVTARIDVTKMSAQNISICLTPSLLQWNPKDAQALVRLSGFTTYVVALIEEARIHCESLEKYLAVL